MYVIMLLLLPIIFFTVLIPHGENSNKFVWGFDASSRHLSHGCQHTTPCLLYVKYVMRKIGFNTWSFAAGVFSMLQQWRCWIWHKVTRRSDWHARLLRSPQRGLSWQHLLLFAPQMVISHSQVRYHTTAWHQRATWQIDQRRDGEMFFLFNVWYWVNSHTARGVPKTEMDANTLKRVVFFSHFKLSRIYTKTLTTVFKD